MHPDDFDDLPSVAVKLHAERSTMMAIDAEMLAWQSLSAGWQRRGVAGAMSGKTLFIENATGVDLDEVGRILGLERVDVQPTSLSYSAPPTLPHLRCSGISLAALEFLYAIEIAAERATRKRIHAKMYPGYVPMHGRTVALNNYCAVEMSRLRGLGT